MKFVLLSMVFAVVLACERDSETSQSGHTHAAPIGHAECAACGMLVGEQPAPRAQVVHRDGTRKYFCSISDLIHYTKAPSPHGEITHTYVEAMEISDDPGATSTAERSWIPAEQAGYVLGVPRKGVMGPPAMTYQTPEEARKAAQIFDGTPVPWVQLGARIHQK